jgi:MarR family transcriptional regulator for hemolysin
MEPPIGRQLHYVAHQAQQAFNAALVTAGGTLPMWLILLAVKRQGAHTQHELARLVGIKGATLTHHLDGLERDGLVTRTRSTDDRRALRVGLTPAGEQRFDALHAAALEYDRRLSAGVTEDALDVFRDVLNQFAANLADHPGVESPAEPR